MQNISVPERLEPDNIVAFLEAHQMDAATAAAKRSEIAVTTNEVPTSSDITDKAKKPEKNRITVSTSTKSAKRTRIYRTVASLAACAALALGCVRYFDLGEVETVETDSKGSSYATDYDELHKTFKKYYADDEDKVTLDSAIAEIENSYNENGADSTGDTSETDPESTDTEADTSVTTSAEPEATSPTGEGASESVDTTTVEAEVEADVTINEGVHLPNVTDGELEDSYLICNDIIYIKDGSTVKVILSDSGTLEYIGDAVPENGLFETKVLEEIYAVGSRLIAVYSVTTEEPVSIPADASIASDEESESSVVEDILSTVYADEETTVTSYSAEVVVYDIGTDGSITSSSTISLSGSYLDSVFKDGYVYVVTNYDQYHNMPLTGDNLDSYVPSYTVNGNKLYIEATNILIPETVSTLDYVVIGGVAANQSGTQVSVQAVLGSEGKVVVSEDAVFVFGYTGNEETSVDKLALSGGTASFSYSATIEGVALSGGTTLSDGTLLVAALRSSDSGYITAVYAFDENLNLLSEVDFPVAYASVSFDGLTVKLGSGSDASLADFSNPSSPTVIESVNVDLTMILQGFGDGFVTFTEDENGYLVLEYLTIDNSGELTLSAEITVSTEDCDSPAIDDNRILYLDSANGLIGVPYKYFDGYDYCCTYAIYKLSSTGFTLVGTVETHEVDSAFEFGRAELSNGILYVMSDGRVYALSVGESSVSIIGSADLIESSYSGHTTW